MAHLPIRKKPTKPEAMSLLPMATVLAVGVLVTALVDGARRNPVDVAHDIKREVTQDVVPKARQAIHAARVATTHAAAATTAAAQPGHQLLKPEDLAGQVFDVAGHAWVSAPLPPITRFDVTEMLPTATVGAWQLVANRTRGATELNPNAHAYDRLYVDLGGARYAALRWRDAK